MIDVCIDDEINPCSQLITQLETRNEDKYFLLLEHVSEVPQCSVLRSLLLLIRYTDDR